MTTTAQSIILDAQTALQDLTGTRWPASELVTYLNDGQRSIVSKRPDQTATTLTFTCVAGAEQTLPATVMTLIDIPRNSTGRKRAMTKVSLPLLDATSRDWRSKTPVSEFSHFCYEARRPRQFEIYPPAIADSTVEIEAALYPTDVAAPTSPGKLASTVSGNIDLRDEFSSALLHFVLFRAYTKEGEATQAIQLAQQHFSLFNSFLAEGVRDAPTS